MAKKVKLKYLSISCPFCHANVKEACTDEYGYHIGTHDVRRRAWKRAFGEALR